MTATRRTRTPGATTTESPGDGQDTSTDKAATSAARTELEDLTPAPAGELPNAIDIDPKTIRGPVLTKQGWVCPDESGRRPPDAAKL